MSDLDDVAAVRALLSSQPRPVGWAARRRRIEEVGAAAPAAPDIVREAATVGGCPAEWSLEPGADRGKVLLYFHGGGYCSGSIVSHRRLVTEAGRAAGIRTLALEYRLAPEDPFPAACEDALAAWRFLRSQGYSGRDIVVGGDSAGGGLTLSLMMRLRDAGEDLPACGWLLSPWTDLAMTGATLDTRDGVDPLIHRSYLEELAGAYVPASVDRRDPRVSPLYGDLRGLPPLLVQVGSAETLLSDSTRLAEAAGSADVAVTLQVWPHMIHAFPLWNAALDAGRRALASAGQFMRGRF
ncbi:alpha/beta hydrolase [Alsobacter sp. R-9]